LSHYAKVENNIVTQVIVAEPEFFDTFVDTTPGEWLKTSYNMKGGIYYNPETNQPAEDQSIINEDEGRKRKNYAGIGYTYDKTRDAFIPPKPFNSWILNEDSCLYEAPVPYPIDDKIYKWDEEVANWIEVKNDL
jgi:hypothetical protein